MEQELKKYQAAIKSMTETLIKANSDLRTLYDTYPGTAIQVATIGMEIEAGMSRAADILEGVA